MSNSFQEQLLKLGLVDKKKINEAKVEKNKSKKAKKAHKQKKQDIDAKPSAQQENIRIAHEAEEKKKERVRALNREREEKLQKRAKLAQIKQIIEQHKIPRDEDGNTYRFTAFGKIYSIRAAQQTIDKLSKGIYGVVEITGASEEAVERFAVIPKEIIVRINDLDSTIFTHIVQAETDDPDDPYAQYKVPDDLMW